MKKKVLLAVAAAMEITSVSFASPLSNYEKGSVAIDLNTMISPDIEECRGNYLPSVSFVNPLTARVV